MALRSERRSRVVASAISSSRFARGLDFARVDSDSSSGQNDTKSPPGPNLQIGSNSLCLRILICTLEFDAFELSDHPAGATAIGCIGRVWLKTLTKTEQKGGRRKETFGALSKTSKG